MANYYCTWRSNYFHVKDDAKFENWANTVPDMKAENCGKRGWVLLQDSGDAAGIPCFRWEENEDGTEDTVEFDMLAEISKHLTKDSVAIFMESGAEKLRYIVGYAVAVDCEGRTKTIDIGNIYSYIQKDWDITPTEVAY